MQTTIDIPPAQAALLARACMNEQATEQELILRALIQYLAQQPPQSAAQRVSIDDAFGIWKDRTDIGDGVEYQRRLRAEWAERDEEIDRLAGFLCQNNPE